MTTKTTAHTEATEIDQIIRPWLDEIPTSQWEWWTVLLTGGHEIEICCPIGAAVEVENAGHIIRTLV